VSVCIRSDEAKFIATVKPISRGNIISGIEVNGMLKRNRLLIVIFFTFLASLPASAACGFDRVDVDGNAEEIAVACEALDGVLAYFAGAGYAVDPVVTVSFQEEVWYEIEAGTGRRLKISGCYDLRRRSIEITRWSTDPSTARRPWGLEWDRAIVASILQHEFVHMAATTILGGDQARLGGAWHEFVAYAVQFELMEPAMRQRILATHPGLAPFESPWAINQLTYAAEPDAFGVQAYLYYRERGGSTYIREILEGEVVAGTGETSHICPWR
jgi:hypothetical protein